MAEKTATRKSTTKAPAKARAKAKTAPRAGKAKGLPVSKHGGVDPEWHNDPARTMGPDAQKRLGEEKGKVEIATFNPQAHHELTINFTELTPNTDFEVKITGPIAAAYYTTLKTDGWGQAQLIWRTPTGGDYLISGKGPGISVSTEFSITAYDADREYRAGRRAAGGKDKSKGTPKGRSKPKAEAATGSVATVEEPAVMGDTSSTEAKNQPTDEELANSAVYDPAAQPAKSPSESSEETGSEEAGKDKE